MELKPGYKQTEIGVLPEDWGVKAVDKLAVVTSGKRLPAGHSLVDHPTPHPYVRVTDMRPGTVSLSEIKFVPEAAFAAIKKYRIFSRDLFISVAGTLGIIGAVPPELDGANLTENADRITDIECSQKYLMYVLMSPLIQNQIESIRTVGAQPKLALARIRKFEIPVPQPSEQVNIAEALSDADALIESLESLIAKKRVIKQGAMQELLSGRRRLPGFSKSGQHKQTDAGTIPEDWECASIDAIIDEISMGPFGSDIKRSNFISAGVPVLSGANVTSVRLNDSFDNFVSLAKAKSLKKAVAGRGDIVVTHRGTIGQISYIPEDSLFDRYVVSQSQFRARFKNGVVLPAWVALYFHSAAGARKLLEGKGHTGVPAIAAPTTTFRKLSVPLPSFVEQQAIADVLFSLDTLISLFEDRLNKARQIKQGMMQKLLTGRIRLV